MTNEEVMELGYKVVEMQKQFAGQVDGLFFEKNFKIHKLTRALEFASKHLTPAQRKTIKEILDAKEYK